jgi:hypothetical protein
MRRLESVPDYIEAEGPVGHWPAPAGKYFPILYKRMMYPVITGRVEAGQPSLNPEVNLGFEIEPWDVSLLSGIPDDLFVDDTIFGIFGG